MKKTIIEWDKLIAEIDGWNFLPNGNCWHERFNDYGQQIEMIPSILSQYHTSWDWLMPVVNKCCILNNNTGITIFCQNDFYLNDIWAVFQSCVKFITSLKKQK